MTTSPDGVGGLRGERPFPQAARQALANPQLRRNIGHATATIRARRSSVVAEVPDWEQLREAGQAIKAATMARLDEHLERLERQVVSHGGQVHWARDANEANQIVAALVHATGASEVVKVKSMATQEIGLNEALAGAGIAAWETDLAELIVQLGHDRPSHILVPAIHRNRAEIRDIFLREMPDVDPGLTDEPARLAEAARLHLRRRFLAARVGVSGANFAVAETGTLAVVESEGNGRMCLTLPDTLITVMGVEKVVPTWADLEVFLQLLPRSATGERMNPYTSMWTGVAPGDGPREFHLVLLDNGRTATLADPVGREALHCIRCSACLNVCPVYERTGGHAYGSVYPGPIGAVLTPQLTGVLDSGSLPYASSLCGACFDACPVRIDIPGLLVHLRARYVEERRATRRLPTAEALSMAAASWIMSSASRFGAVIRLAGAPTRLGRAARSLRRKTGPGRSRIRSLPPPLSAWTETRDAPVPPPESFREWWQRTRGTSAVPDGDDTGTARPGAAGATHADAADGRLLGRPDAAAQATDAAVGTRTAAGTGTATGTGVGARVEMLDRIRSAHGAPPGPDAPAVPRRYRREGDHQPGSPALLDLLAQRLTDYRAQVYRTTAAELPATLAAVTAAVLPSAALLVVPPGLPEGYAPPGSVCDGPATPPSATEPSGMPGAAEPPAAIPDAPALDAPASGTPVLDAPTLDAAGGVLTTCAAAAAETGTIVLDGSAGQGRRALSLVPDRHICVVRADQVVQTVPELLARLDPTRPLTLISGPSATSDIELHRVEGVHGPRTLAVVLVEGQG